MKTYGLLVLAVLTALTSFPSAAGSECPEHYAGSPPVVKQPFEEKLRELCFDAFAVGHSGLTRTPLYSAYQLTRESILAAEQVDREDAFHPEQRLPADERAELADYRGSGMDRGHLFEAAAAPTEEAQHQGFSLANIVPQAANHNRILWAKLESGVRSLAKSKGELFVITGALFLGDELQQLNDRVFVPSHLYKLVYSPADNAAAAYVSKNSDAQTLRVVTLEGLELLSGMQFLDGIDDVGVLPLPKPKAKKKVP